MFQPQGQKERQVVEPPKPDLFDRVRSIARVLLVLYVPGVLFMGLAVFGYFLYGLAHASKGAAAQFFALLVIGVAAAIRTLRRNETGRQVPALRFGGPCAGTPVGATRG